VLLATLEGAEGVPGAAPSTIPESTYHDALDAAYREWKDLEEGNNAAHIPALAKVDPKLYGIALVTVQGAVYELGNARHEFSIQAIARPLTLARTIDGVGIETVRKRLGSNPSGIGSPFVTSGAIATIDLMPGNSAAEKLEVILGIYSAFAARRLAIDEEIFRASSGTNTRDPALAALLKNREVIKGDPTEALRLHAQQCSIRVSALDLAVMGASLANGGRNPLSRYQIVSAETAREVLAVMARSGMNETTSGWPTPTGLAAASGASGGIMAIMPGHFAVGIFSPPLDGQGHSVRGQKALATLAKRLGRATSQRGS
jgi:glutaminase